MKTYCSTAIFSIILLSSGIVQADRFLFPQPELMNPAFKSEWFGWGTLNGRTALTAPAVRFQITLGPEGYTMTAIGDSWPIESAAGLAWDGGYYPGSPSAPHASPHNNISIAAWDGMQMRVKYLSGPGDIQMRLYLHAGITGASAYPPNTPSNDMTWQGPLQTLSVGETALLDLDFDNALVWNAFDNLYPHSGYGQNWADETWHAINERDRREVHGMGFKVYGPANGQVVIDANAPVPEPSSLTLSVTAAVFLCLMLMRMIWVATRRQSPPANENHF